MVCVIIHTLALYFLCLFNFPLQILRSSVGAIIRLLFDKSVLHLLPVPLVVLLNGKPSCVGYK